MGGEDYHHLDEDGTIILSMEMIIILMKTEDGSDVDHDGDSDNQIQL